MFPFFFSLELAVLHTPLGQLPRPRLESAHSSLSTSLPQLYQLHAPVVVDRRRVDRAPTLVLFRLLLHGTFLEVVGLLLVVVFALAGHLPTLSVQLPLQVLHLPDQIVHLPPDFSLAPEIAPTVVLLILLDEIAVESSVNFG